MPFLLLIISISLVVFVGIKASLTSFTHDESYSYLRYVGQSFMQIISYDTPFTNNHILNSLLMKYFEMIFGSSEIALRGPNIIALILYLFYIYLLLKDRNFLLVLTVFILMSVSPYLLDFFGLARGYGLSIAFMIFSLYHLLNFFKSDKQKDLFLFNSGALLATLSNFALLDYWVAAVLTFNFIVLLDAKMQKNRLGLKDFFLRYNRMNFIFLMFGAVVLYEPLLKIIQLNIIDFGGRTGFVRDTIGTLIIKIFYRIPLGSETWNFLKISAVIIVVLILLVIIKNILSGKVDFIRNFKPLIAVNFILILVAAITIIQHLLFQMDYLMGRFALFLFPLFILNIGFVLEYFLSKGYKLVTIGVATILVGLTFLNFSLNVNCQSYLDWLYEADTKNAVNELMKSHEQDNTNQTYIKLGIHWLFEPSLNFYRKTRSLDWLLELDREGVKENDDYLYLFVEDFDKESYPDGKIIFSSDSSKTVLVKNK